LGLVLQREKTARAHVGIVTKVKRLAFGEIRIFGGDSFREQNYGKVERDETRKILNVVARRIVTYDTPVYVSEKVKEIKPKALHMMRYSKRATEKHSKTRMAGVTIDNFRIFCWLLRLLDSLGN
jgi:hypothetical protein